MIGAVEICDRARDLQDAIVRAGSEPLLLHSAFEQAFGVCTELAMSADLAGGHLSIGEDAIAGFLETMVLAIPR